MPVSRFSQQFKDHILKKIERRPQLVMLNVRGNKQIENTEGSNLKIEFEIE